jgi:hypothetical protein
VLGVSLRGGVDHLLRAVDAGEPALAETVAHEGCGHAVAASHFEDAVGGLDGEGLHRPRLVGTDAAHGA